MGLALHGLAVFLLVVPPLPFLPPKVHGTEVVVFRPGVAEQDAMGNDFMSSENVERVVQGKDGSVRGGSGELGREGAPLECPGRRLDGPRAQTR